MPDGRRRQHVVVVFRAVRLVEAYVPGLRDMPSERYAVIASALLDALAVPTGNAVVALIPADEVALVLVRDAEGLSSGNAAEMDVMVQRVVDAWVGGPYDDAET